MASFDQPGFRMMARVGVAKWHVTLSPDATRHVFGPDAGATDLAPAHLHRIMESARRTAVALRFYGGGMLRLDTAQIVPPIEPACEEDGSPRPLALWFDMLGAGFVTGTFGRRRKPAAPPVVQLAS